MKTFPKYLIKLDVDDTSRFLSAIEPALGGRWTRLPDLPCALGGSYLIFQRNQPSCVRLFILRDDAETLSIVNIVPRRGALTIAAYKEILLDFQASVLETVLSSGFNLTFLLGSDDLNVDHLLHPAALQHLDRFAALANKDTLHPFDRDRWIAFLIAHHRSRCHAFLPYHLRAWLRARGFSESIRANLEHEFDFALTLLKLYDDSAHGSPGVLQPSENSSL